MSETRSTNTVPMESSSFDSMTLDEAKAQKKRLTQRIKAFDAEFKELHGRDPTKEDYEISGLRADFDKYELARQRIAELRQLAKQSQVAKDAVATTEEERLAIERARLHDDRLATARLMFNQKYPLSTGCMTYPQLCNLVHPCTHICRFRTLSIWLFEQAFRSFFAGFSSSTMTRVMICTACTIVFLPFESL